MSKISMPSDGITNKVSGQISRCQSALQNAQNNTSFSIPSGFQYSNFCYGLGSQISEYSKEINDISKKVQETEKNYSNLSEKTQTVNSTPASIIDLHDRLVSIK